MSIPTNLVGKRVSNGRIELTSLLGEGTYGSVYHGIIHRGFRIQKRCAVKVQRIPLDQHQRLCLFRELRLHRQVSDCEGIVTLHETFKEGDFIFIVMKLCPDGDLWSSINKGRFLGNDLLIKDLFTQVLDAVEYCHSQSVYHRDIKPENILLCNGGLTALLADFGLATDQALSDEMRLGSPWYMSPECWGGLSNISAEQYYSAPNDVWSLGILLINLACGRHAPWKHAHQSDHFFKDFLNQPNLLRLFVPLAPQVHDILARILEPNPVARISITDLKIAVKNVEYFVIPSSRRGEYQKYQRAVWRATVRPAPSRTISIKMIPAFHAPSPTTREHVLKDDSPTTVPSGVNSSRTVFDRDTTIINTSPYASPVARECSGRLLSLSRSSSSTSSVDSDGPATPDMPAMDPDIVVPHIADLSQDEAPDVNQIDVAVKVPPPPKKTAERPSVPSRDSWQGVLDAIRAM